MIPWSAWSWPWFGALEAWRLGLKAFEPLSEEDPPQETVWTTPNRPVLDLGALRLRDFSFEPRSGPAVLVVAPFAVHDAGIADLAPGHSLIEALRRQGCRCVFLAEWTSATHEMRYNTIDSQLSALNAAVDDLGPPLAVVGLCQGGWLSLVYAARFPKKLRKLALIGAPVDTSWGAAPAPSEAFVEQLIRLGRGRVLGRHSATLWPHDPDMTRRMTEALQLGDPEATEAESAAASAYAAWEKRTLNLPGVYFRQVFEWLYKDNRLARGDFPALGRKVGLRGLTTPLYLLAGAQDAIVPAPQLFAAASLIGDGCDVTTALAAGGHCALFMGARTIRENWPQIAAWLQS